MVVWSCKERGRGRGVCTGSLETGAGIFFFYLGLFFRRFVDLGNACRNCELTTLWDVAFFIDPLRPFSGKICRVKISESPTDASSDCMHARIYNSPVSPFRFPENLSLTGSRDFTTQSSTTPHKTGVNDKKLVHFCSNFHTSGANFQTSGANCSLDVFHCAGGCVKHDYILQA